MVVAQDGTEKIAATWVTGSAPAGASVAGAASIDLGRIARVEVRNTAGQVFSTVPVV